MDFKNLLKSIPIVPIINCDGYYAQCHRCYTELKDEEKVCPNCNQAQDWSWLSKYKHGGNEYE